MKTYATSDDRKTVLTLSTMITWAERLAVKPTKRLDKPCHKRRARQILNHLTKLTEAAVEGMDYDARDGLFRFARNNDVQIVPKDRAKNSKEYVVMEAADFQYMMDHVFADCNTCLATPAEIKKCEFKKILQRCGAVPDGTPWGECPFQP